MGNTPTFTIAGWTVKPGFNLIERADDSVKVEPRTMDVLVCLARHAPEVVSADELIDEVWHGRLISDGSIYQRITHLRSAFGENIPDLIETIPKRGYRLAATVTLSHDAPLLPDAPAVFKCRAKPAPVGCVGAQRRSRSRGRYLRLAVVATSSRRTTRTSNNRGAALRQPERRRG